MVSKIIYSLVFIKRKDEILLGLKKRGFGEGKWNGFGGKLKVGETVLEGAIREVKEECGLDVEALQKIALINFEEKGSDVISEVHVFKTSKYHGDLIETEEMQPKWYNVKDIPFNNMWPDDTYWFPYMLQGILFKAYFLYKGQDEILKQNIEIVKELPVEHIL